MEVGEETKLFRYFTTVRDLKELDELVKHNRLLQPGDIVIVEENRYSYMICANNNYIFCLLYTSSWKRRVWKRAQSAIWYVRISLCWKKYKIVG